MVGRREGRYRWLTEADLPAVDRPPVARTWATPGVLLRAYVYARMLGREGMQRVAEYRDAQRQLPDGAAAQGRLRRRLSARGAPSHEFIVTLRKL